MKQTFTREEVAASIKRIIARLYQSQEEFEKEAECSLGKEEYYLGLAKGMDVAIGHCNTELFFHLDD